MKYKHEAPGTVPKITLFHIICFPSTLMEYMLFKLGYIHNLTANETAVTAHKGLIR